ncbi:MAG: dihydroneopterin aldolase [Proteobacteria bacterium]|nr:dihydroneopterin aldolase [Pseudomonadota bacterium]
MQNNSSSIIISGLELSSHIGVPDSERLEAQRLTLNLELVPVREMTALGDALENTVDYFALTRRVRLLAAARPRKLIETLAEEICTCVLSEFSVRAVDLELRKYILPDTEYVAIRMQRVRSSLTSLATEI